MATAAVISHINVMIPYSGKFLEINIFGNFRNLVHFPKNRHQSSLPVVAITLTLACIDIISKFNFRNKVSL